MIKRVRHRLGICVAICIYMVLGILHIHAIDPSPLIVPENVDSAMAANISNATAEAKMRKEMNSFYSNLNTKVPERKFKIRSQDSKLADVLQFGEILIPERSPKERTNKERKMWGEVDYSFELKEQIRNYEALIEGYEKHLNWAKKKNNKPIIELMNVKIKKTKGLIKECKRKLRKY